MLKRMYKAGILIYCCANAKYCSNFFLAKLIIVLLEYSASICLGFYSFYWKTYTKIYASVFIVGLFIIIQDSK